MTDKALQTLAEVFPLLDAAAVQRLCDAARIVTLPADVTLCHEGELEDSFYVIVDGSVDVYKVLEGQRLLINQMPSGACFGDLALLLDVPRTATIVTAEPSRILEISRTTFASLLATHPAIVVEISRHVLRRFLAQEEKHLVEIARLKRRDVPPARVFLSYARADEAFVARLANNLLKQQIDVWFDRYRLEPGKSWSRQVSEALDSCNVLLVVLSPASVASENVEDEWNYFLDHKRPTVTVLHEACKVPYRLSKLQHIDFNAHHYDQALARLVATLNTQF